MIEKYTAQASTKEEAIEKGLKELGISENEADIVVNDPGKKGFLGIGQKDAVVTVKRKKSISIDDTNLSFQSDLNEDGREENIEQAADQAEEEAVMPPISSDKAQEQVEDLEDDMLEKKSEVASTDQTDEEIAGSSDNDKLEETVEETEEEAVMPPLSTDKAQEQVEDLEDDMLEEDELKKQKETEEKDEAAIEEVRSYLQDILIHMGIEDAEVSINRKEDQVYFDVETEEAGLVIGRHGKVLNGLQTLIQIRLHQSADTKLFARVDAENYRSRRKETVEHLAKKTATQVKKTNQPVILEPMPAHERKQIHRHLYKDSSIKTHSEGKEPHRYLVVEPADL